MFFATVASCRGLTLLPVECTQNIHRPFVSNHPWPYPLLRPCRNMMMKDIIVASWDEYAIWRGSTLPGFAKFIPNLSVCRLAAEQHIKSSCR